jgi:hypothetical protein
LREGPLAAETFSSEELGVADLEEEEDLPRAALIPSRAAASSLKL